MNNNAKNILHKHITQIEAEMLSDAKSIKMSAEDIFHDCYGKEYIHMMDNIKYLKKQIEYIESDIAQFKEINHVIMEIEGEESTILEEMYNEDV
jgi:hypothetical protein